MKGSELCAGAELRVAELSVTRAPTFDVASFGKALNAISPGWIASGQVESFVRGLTSFWTTLVGWRDESSTRSTVDWSIRCRCVTHRVSRIRHR